MSTEKPRREFWIKDYPMAKTVKGVKLYDAFDGWIERNDTIHVVEIKPGDIVLSRHKFRGAFHKAYLKPWDERDGLFNALTIELFGEVE